MYYRTENYYNTQAEKFRWLSKSEQEALKEQNPRREITQRHDATYISRVTDLVGEAKAFAEQWGKTLEDVKMDTELEDDYGSQYAKLYCTVEGLETDAQYEARLWELIEQTKAREDHDRKEFERLSAKFAKK